MLCLMESLMRRLEAGVKAFVSGDSVDRLKTCCS